MSDQVIKCPNCGKQIPLDKALGEQMKHDLESELVQREKELKKELWEVAQEKAREKIEKEAGEEKKELEKQRLQQEKEKIRQEKEMKELREELMFNAKKLEESEKHELELRKKSRELEEREKSLELEMARKMDEERKKIIESTQKQEEEQYRLKIQEKDKQMEILNKTIGELKRKSEQGSQQIQGEVQEDDLKNLLATTFATDEVSDVVTGAKGADLVQRINAKMGTNAGTIIWESKNTKAFSESWISKLKSDQGLVKADIAILVTQVLPKGVNGFGLVNGVWVVSYAHVIPLVNALRIQLIEVAKVKLSLVGRDEKMGLLYKYLSGPQFKNRVENIVMA
ncbi:DUF2130 domain-containing protein, partial [Patescibacteria group bacterium]|nr:DUF2130 domain-containing protein [Patescibacteria group bacterium]